MKALILCGQAGMKGRIYDEIVWDKRYGKGRLRGL